MKRFVSVLVLGWLAVNALGQSNRLCFVQFIHPGQEHQPDSAAGRSWNTDAHRRKFLIHPGRALASRDATPQAGNLLFWGEYEPPTRLVKTFADPLPRGPRFLFAPAPVPFYEHTPPLMNTDPFVFGDCFFYSICKQNRKSGPSALQRLERGSVILFGSGQGRTQFVVDTVFVVADYVDWSMSNYRETLQDIVPPEYFHATLEPIVYEARYWQSAMNSTFRLYFGATVEKPVAEMFSYFPCRPADQSEPRGFARPAVRYPGIITDNLTQGQRMNPQQDLAAVQALWREMTDQVLAQGLQLGIQAELPTVE